MSAFDALQKYYSSPGNMGAPRATMREESAANPAHVVDGELEHGSRPVENALEKDDLDEAKQTVEDQPDVRGILEGIKAKNADTARSNRKIQNLEKAAGGPLRPDRGYMSPKSNPQIAEKAWGIFYRIFPHLRGDFRNTPNYKTGDSPKSTDTKEYRQYARIYDAVESGESEKAAAKKGKKAVQAMSMEKSQVSPQLARLLSAAAGWALSGDIAGKVDPHLAQEWDRASSHRDKKELQEEMMRQMHRMHKKPQAKLLVIHRKSDDGNFLADNSAFRKLSMFYKEEDDVFARARQQEEEDTVPYDDDDFDEEAAGMPKARYNAIESNDAAHYYAGEAGWGGEEHDEEDFHPETGELQVPGKNANDVRDWAKGVQEQYGVPLVGGPTGNEPHDDIYQHYGIEGGHMSQKPITAQHIADYVQNKTGHPVSMPGTQTPTVPGAQKPPVPGTQAPTTPGTQAPSVQQMIKDLFMKDHAPIPPRYGLQWDAVKHRWTRPEKIGRTVWEVQGHKRFRGTGTGAHERGRRAGGSGGYGVGSSEAGRRFRSVGDVGRVHPHEAKQPGQKELHRFGKVKKLPRMGMKRR